MIPDFLKRTNNTKEDKMLVAMGKYEKPFGQGVNTEPSTFSDDDYYMKAFSRVLS